MYILDVIKKYEETSIERKTYSAIPPLVRSSYEGFFTPFKDVKDAGKALIAPITDPAILSFLAVANIGKAIGNVLGLLYMTITCGLTCGLKCDLTPFRNQIVRNYLAYSALAIFEHTFLAVGFALVAAAAVPVLALHTITRALTTVGSLIGSGVMALVDAFKADDSDDNPCNLPDPQSP